MIRFLSTLLFAVVLIGTAHAAPVRPSHPIVKVGPLCEEGNILCKFFFTALVGFAIIDWAVPLNDPNASPERCRGKGSIIKAPPPQGTSLCKLE